MFSLVLLLLSVPTLPEVFAQTPPASDPFDQEVPLEFSKVTQALDHDDYDQALKLLSKLRVEYLKSRNKLLKAEILAKIKEVNRLNREFAKLHREYAALKKNSNDPEALKAIGNFYCLEKGDWGKGLLLLSKSDSPELRQTVLSDLKRPVTPTERMKLADAWWEQASQEKGPLRKAYHLRGRYWYILARPFLTPEQRVYRDKQLQQLVLEADKIVIWNQHNGSYGDRGTLACIVTLLYQGKSVWRKSVQLPWLIDAPASATVKPPHVRFDQVRIDVTNFRGGGGGLGEVEIFDGTIKLSQNCSAVAKEYFEENRQFHPSNVTDGDKSGASGYWLLNNGQQGWVLIDMVNYLQQQ
tara:strand:+ start:2685 stop:3746 length:1062 start_codon:yes stop_codon:yes gene_type:complete